MHDWRRLKITLTHRSSRKNVSLSQIAPLLREFVGLCAPRPRSEAPSASGNRAYLNSTTTFCVQLPKNAKRPPHNAARKAGMNEKTLPKEGTMADLENVRVFTQSAIRIQSESGIAIYLDPFHLTDDEAAHDADIVLITHAHFDHCSPDDIARVAGKHTTLVAPKSMEPEVSGIADAIGAAGLYFMQAGEHLELQGIAIDAVGAYNAEPERLGMHPRANGWLGYVLTVDGVRYYAAGDTDQNPDNEHVACDVAFVPIGGTYTCDPHQAAAFVNTLHPQAVVPIHYGSIVGSMSDFDAFAAEVDPAIRVVRKLER